MVTATYSASTSELARFYGYGCEEHAAVTSDGFVLILHRITPRHGPRHGAPPVLVQHGLLQCSETWVTTNDALAFALVDAGFDVWLANNRGNRYSCKHTRLRPDDRRYWDFSLDQHALIDLPTNVDAVLRVSGTQRLAYVGFSQGSAMGFAGFSLSPELSAKINVFVALAPAARAVGLQSGLLKTFVDCAPDSLYLLFGNTRIVPSAIWWRNNLSPGLFVTTIDLCVRYLFGWRTASMSRLRKKLCYPHLYSPSSVKTVVHWFQIVISNRFQMYDDSFTTNSAYTGAVPVEYPISQLSMPLALFYGGEDKLPDFEWLLSVVPASATVARIPHYEHVDLMWADDASDLVFNPVIDILAAHADAVPVPVPAPRIPDSRRVA